MLAKTQEEIENTIKKLQKRAANYEEEALQADKEYDILTDKYMNGEIDFSIGKYQRRLESRANRCRKKAERELGRAEYLRKQYNLPEEKQAYFMTM